MRAGGSPVHHLHMPLDPPTRPVARIRQLDYYRVAAAESARAEAILVEELVLRDDGTAIGIDSVLWTAVSRAWQAASEFSRDLRIERACANGSGPSTARPPRPCSGCSAGTSCRTRRCCGPGSATSCRCRPRPCCGSGRGRRRPGFRERRVYRILFAGELDRGGLRCLRTRWLLDPVEPAADPTGQIAGRARRTVDDHELVWELRRVGAGLGWAVDVTADLADAPVAAALAVLRELRQQARAEGLVPVTVERLG